jgi:hypothetical protein
MSTDESNSEKQSPPVVAGFLYPLTVGFPSWAGAILVVYAIFLGRLSGLKFRVK